MAEPIKMSFVLWTGLGKRVFITWVVNPPQKGALLEDMLWHARGQYTQRCSQEGSMCAEAS